MSKPLKDDEISEIIKNEDLEEDYEGENIKTLLGQVEYSVDR